VGPVDSTQENLWPSGIASGLRSCGEHSTSLITPVNDAGQTHLVRTRECLPALFEGFNDNCVLVHGNFTLRSVEGLGCTIQLLAMVGPGIMLWPLREMHLLPMTAR
jgi:hypothetical protein